MDFPSVPRTGFYNYGRIAQKHRMDLGLVFTDSTISGDGSNDIGRFFVTGHFDETNGECSWTKAYIGGHDVFYGGFWEGKGKRGLWGMTKESSGAPLPPRGTKKANMAMKGGKSRRQEKPVHRERWRG